MTLSISTPPPLPAGKSPARDFTANERNTLLRAQQRLNQQRINAQVALEGLARPTRQFQSPVTEALEKVAVGKAPVRHFETPDRLTGIQTIPGTITAALDRARKSRLSLPITWALEGLKRAHVILEEHIRRRDARHNAEVVLLALLQAAYTMIHQQGQNHVHTTSYTFFTVLELLPVVTGLSSDQCERATRRLQTLGLIHKSSGAIPVPGHQNGPGGRARAYTGGTWMPTTFMDAETGQATQVTACAGTWIAVLLRPLPGRKARVIAHELPPCPRDLSADRLAGRTAWRICKEAGTEVRESISPTRDNMNVAPMLVWSLPQLKVDMGLDIQDSRTSMFSDAKTPQELVWSLSRIVAAHPRHRRAVIQEGTVRLVTLLNDTGWEKHYYRILWRATEAEFSGLRAYNQLAYALERTLIAERELSLRRPGAWLTQQLRHTGWLDAVYHRSPEKLNPVSRSAAATQPLTLLSDETETAV